MLTERYRNLEAAVEKTLTNLNDAERLAHSVLDVVISDVMTKFYHKLGVGVEDSVADLLDDFKQKVVNQVINEADRWKIPKSDIVIFPRNCRFFYEKGDSTIVVIEDEPKKRTVKLGNLVPSRASEPRRVGYTLPMPYVVYIFHIKNFRLVNSYIGWRTTPLIRTSDKLSRPLLPNSHESLEVCWGANSGIAAPSVVEVCDKAITQYWVSDFNGDLRTRWDSRGTVSDKLVDVSRWAAEDVMFMMSLNYSLPNDPTVEDKITQITGHVDNPDMEKIRHGLLELTEKHSEILFSKIIGYFKRVKPERFYPKDITALLKDSLEMCVRDYLDVFHVLQLEYNKLEKRIQESKGRTVRKCGPYWDEEMKNG